MAEPAGDPAPGAFSAPPARGRKRDMFAAAMLGCIVLGGLALSGSLLWIEALTAAALIVTLVSAYAIAAQPAPGAARQTGGTSEIAPPQPMPGRTGLDAVCEAVPLPMLVIAPGGIIAAANQGARDVFRFPSPAQRGRVLAEAALRRPGLLDAAERAARGERAPPILFETELPSRKHWKAHVAPLALPRPPLPAASPTGGAGPGAPEENEPERLILVMLEDQTELRMAARSRADFLANASHELRTPLTTLTGFIETLRGTAASDPGSWPHFLSIMERQADRMNRLVEDLLALSQLEHKEHRRPSATADLAALARDIAADMELAAGDADLDLETGGLSAGALPVGGNEDELARAVSNLLSNAIKYAPGPGEIRLSAGWARGLEPAKTCAYRQSGDAARVCLVEAAARADGGTAAAWAWLRVEDGGPGIARQHLPRLGERFYRVDESRSAPAGGTGLGLAIVKHTLSRHGGGLGVESLEGGGTAFGIWLPLAEEVADAGDGAETAASERQVGKDSVSAATGSGEDTAHPPAPTEAGAKPAPAASAPASSPAPAAP